MIRKSEAKNDNETCPSHENHEGIIMDLRNKRPLL
jgi:hypothetical protein